MIPRSYGPATQSAAVEPTGPTAHPHPGVAVPSSREPSDPVGPPADLLAAVAAATERVTEVVDRLSEADLRGPSRLPGWSRAHVVTHLARNADGLVNLLTWARTGVEHPMYASWADRNADIEHGAQRSAQVLRADLEAASQRFAAQAAELPEAAWSAELTNAQGKQISARVLPLFRLRELSVHLVDLDAGAGFADLPDDLLEPLLEDAVRQYAGRDDVPAVELVVDLPDGRQRSWRLTAAEPASTTTGSAASALGWLTGREDGSGLSGNPPTLPNWI
jgi:maleylpyruvate isomerase